MTSKFTTINTSIMEFTTINTSIMEFTTINTSIMEFATINTSIMEFTTINTSIMEFAPNPNYKCVKKILFCNSKSGNFLLFSLYLFKVFNIQLSAHSI